VSHLKLEARCLHEDGWLDRSPAAFVVHVYALSYCNEQATDGLISTSRATRLVCSVPPADLAAAWAELLDAGLWRSTDDGYLCDTFTTYGLAADEQNATRAKWNADKHRQRLHRIGNHDLCTPRSCPVARGQVDTSTEEPTGDKWTTRPDPTRPDSTRPSGGEEGRGSGDGPSSSARASGEDPSMAKEKHHHGPGCCGLADYPTNRHHWRPSECPGCDDPRHEKEAA